MPNSPRMRWPYPGRDTDPWFETFLDMLQGLDASGFASREDRQLILGGGGTASFEASTGTVSWTAPIEIFSPIGGFILSIPAGSIVLENGEVLYVTLSRSPTQNVTLSTAKAANVPNTDDAFALAIRRGSNVFWRHGIKLGDGESIDLFVGGGGSGSGTDTYERSASFGLINGSNSSEATVGVITYVGSLVGLSMSLADPSDFSAGSITANAKINGVTKLSGTVTPGTGTSHSTVAGGTHPVVQDDEVTIEMTGPYLSTSGNDGGVVVTLTFLVGVGIAPGDMPDASLTQKGITKLSVAPVLATDPIAVGDNDPRLVEVRRILYTVAQPADGSDFDVSIVPAMPNLNYVVQSTLATAVSHVTIAVPTGGRTPSQFNVITSAELDNGDTIYFTVQEI